MPAVMHELVDDAAGIDQRQCAFLGADEIDGKDQDQPGEDRPGVISRMGAEMG